MLVIVAVLIIFWATMAAIVATTFALSNRPGEQARATTTASPTVTATATTEVPAPTPTVGILPERPAELPVSAVLVTAPTVLGDDTPPPESGFDQQTIFFALRCDGDLLTVSTSRHVIYATLDCLQYWLPDDVVRPFLAQPVRVTVVPGEPVQLTFFSASGDIAAFVARAVWVQSLN
jgi:hypothetical protein